MAEHGRPGSAGLYNNQVQPTQLPNVQTYTAQGAAISVDVPADIAMTTKNQREDRLDPHGSSRQSHLHERQAQELQSAKDRALRTLQPTPQMIDGIEWNGSPAAMPGGDPYSVSELPLSIQAGFRKKMLTLLFLQLSFSIALAFLLRYTPSLKGPLEDAFPAQGGASLGLMVAVLFGLPIMSCVKDNHPWNLLFTLAWSVLLGLFLAASDLEGAFSRAHAFLMIMSLLTTGVFFLALFTQLPWRGYDGEPRLMRFSYAGLGAWLCLLIGGSVVFSLVKDDVDWQEPADGEGKAFDPVPVFVTSVLVSTAVFAWFCYEAHKLCGKMQPDEYLKGVIYFYTDMFYVCACCALIACLGGGGGNGGAPPKDEEER